MLHSTIIWAESTPQSVIRDYLEVEGFPSREFHIHPPYPQCTQCPNSKLYGLIFSKPIKAQSAPQLLCVSPKQRTFCPLHSSPVLGFGARSACRVLASVALPGFSSHNHCAVCRLPQQPGLLLLELILQSWDQSTLRPVHPSNSALFNPAPLPADWP